MSLAVRATANRLIPRTPRPTFTRTCKRRYALLKPPSFVQEATEVTLYVKGFLARGESADDFHDWFASHKIISDMEHKKWSPNVAAFHWKNGDLPLPVPLVSGALLGYRLLKLKSSLLKLTPVGLLAGASVDVALYAGLLATEYYKAEKSLDEQSLVLADALLRLHMRHSKVRVVAHSLGCRLLLNATQAIPEEQRPHEVHLLAPAFTEDDVGPHLDHLARDQVSIYHNKDDYILSLLYAGVTAGSTAVGCSGLRQPYAKATSIDTSPHFDWLVHTEYKNNFHKFAH